MIPISAIVITILYVLTSGQARPTSPGLQGVDMVDGDIKKLVQAFVHKQFGQSKRISEKDKKSVER